MICSIRHMLCSITHNTCQAMLYNTCYVIKHMISCVMLYNT